MTEDGRPDVALPKKLYPLMFEAFAGSMAMMAFAALAGPVARATRVSAWQIGAVMAVAGVTWMLMARRWGRLSDVHGRRRILIGGAAGFALSFAGLAGFVAVVSERAVAPGLVFAGLLIARALGGFFYAAVPAISAAWIADITGASARPKAMAALAASSSLGIVVGPALVGLLAGGGVALPLAVIAVLPLLGAAILWWRLPTDGHRLAAAPAGPSRVPSDAGLGPLTMAAFLAMGSVSVAQVIVGFFAIDRLGLSPVEGARVAGTALAGVGLSLLAAQAVMRRLSLPAIRIMTYGLMIGAAGFAVAGLATTAAWLLAGYAFAAFGMGWVFPSVIAQATSVVRADGKGHAAGTISAAQAFGVTIGPPVGTLVYMIDPRLPFAIIVLALGAASFAARRLPGTHEPRP